MENSKTMTKDQVEKLKETVRQRFDDLYQRIGTNRQKLATTVLSVHQSINKELAKDKIEGAQEKKILGQLREVEKVANNQLPHVHKATASTASAGTSKVKKTNITAKKK